MYLIIGLGNPDKEYNSTRHNIGFIVLDKYLNEEKWQSKFDSLYCERRVGGKKVVFIKPQTYMNNSGLAVKKVVDYFDISIENILVVQDDMDMEIGSYKIKKFSSSGGHNGIRSIISHLSSDEFARLKVGISHDKNGNTINHVLGNMSKSEIDTIENLEDIFGKIIESFVNDGVEKTMNVYNTREK